MFVHVLRHLFSSFIGWGAKNERTKQFKVRISNHWTARFTVLMRFSTRIHTVHKRCTRPASEDGAEMIGHWVFSEYLRMIFVCVDFRMLRILTGKGSTDRMLCASYNSNGSQSVSSMAFGIQCIVCHYKPWVDPSSFFLTNTENRKTPKNARNCFVVN